MGGEAAPDLGAIAAAPGAIAGGEDTLPIWSWGICTGNQDAIRSPTYTLERAPAVLTDLRNSLVNGSKKLLHAFSV